MKNLTPKEKADDLYVGFWYLTNDARIAKQCAIIAVDEIIKEIHELGEVWMKRRIQYWLEVKSKIEKI